MASKKVARSTASNGRRGPLTPQDFVETALAFVDENGLGALSMRALGAELNVDATALYRHFPNKESLLDAMVDRMLAEAVRESTNVTGTPRERIIGIALASRSAFERHPDIGVALVSTDATLPHGGQLSLMTLSCLREMGLDGRDLVLHYQSLEQYVLGSSVFDFTSSPHNFDIRRSRYRLYEVDEFDAVSRSTKEVAQVATEAFMVGINAMLDACERTVARKKKSGSSKPASKK